MKLAKRNKVPRRAWERVQHDMMEEARTVPGFDQMERKAYIENDLAALEQRYQSHYVAGWVNLADAQFLYWVVRHIKPTTIVQTGVSNGLSSAFMMLALAKNGPQGRLHVTDLPAIFDPADPAWTRKDAVYGFVIPQGKSSGWMVPDIYRGRFDVEIGDAKVLLPRLVDGLEGSIYSITILIIANDHMKFEFDQAARRYARNGVGHCR